MRRFGGVLFLVVLAACGQADGDRKLATVPSPAEATIPPSTSTSSTTSTSTTTTVVRPTTTTLVARLTPTTAATPRAAAGACDPNYAGACIPVWPPDVDCGDLSAKRFRVIGRDVHRLDADHDGIACES
jgi:hypothetical protein